jgi:EAL domain-containing protein (putative c-di-GMP-specific phosphodiesterase class I)
MGTLSSGEIRTLAEESGLGAALTQWLISSACGQLQTWRTQHPLTPRLHLNLELSVRQTQDPAFLKTLQDALQQHHVDPGSLQIEITEEHLVRDVDALLALLSSLKSAGVRLTMDGLGSGYSSLANLTRFPIDTVKIDRFFVEQVDTGAPYGAIVNAVLLFAHTMELTATAEGIETFEQLEALRAARCDTGRGTYFAGPLTPEAFEELWVSGGNWTWLSQTEGAIGATRDVA